MELTKTNKELRKEVVDQFAEEIERDYAAVPHYRPKGSEVLLIGNCSMLKTDHPGVVPAYFRYIGRETSIYSRMKFEFYPRMNFDYYIISAKYGLIPSDALIEDYDKTFTVLMLPEVKKIGKLMRIREDLDHLLKTNQYKMVFLMVSNQYMYSIDLTKPFETESTLIYFQLKRLEGTKNELKAPNAIPIPLDNVDIVKRFGGFPLVALKAGVIERLFMKYRKFEFLDHPKMIQDFVADYQKPKKATLF